LERHVTPYVGRYPVVEVTFTWFEGPDATAAVQASVTLRPYEGLEDLARLVSKYGLSNMSAEVRYLQTTRGR
jgi:hypothetical protein